MGQRRDQAPPVELIDAGEDNAVQSEAVVTSTSRRWWVAACAGLLCLAILILVIGDDRTGDSDSSSSPSTSTAPSTTAGRKSQPSQTQGSYRTGRPEPVLPEAPIPGWLLLGSASGDWRQIDLSTGWVAPIPASAGLRAVDPRGVVPVPGGVVFMDERPASPRVVRLHAAGAGRQETELESGPFPLSADLSGGAQEVYEVIDIRSSGLDDHLWIITRSGYPGQERERRATLVDLNGDVMLGPFPIPAHPVAGSEVGVLFNAGGHGYLVDEAGVRDLGEGDIAAAAGRFAGRIRCSAEAQCHPQSFALDPATGSYDGTRIPTEAAAAGAVTVSISPDGSLAVLPVRFGGMSSFAVGSGQTTSMLITPRDGQPRSVPVDNARSAPTWLPDNNGLLLLTGLGLRYYSDVDGELASRAIANLLPEDATSVLYVPPGNRDD